MFFFQSLCNSSFFNWLRIGFLFLHHLCNVQFLPGFCGFCGKVLTTHCVFSELTSCFKPCHFLLCLKMFLLIFSLKHWGNTDIKMNPTALGLWGLLSCFWGRRAGVWFFRSCVPPPKDFYPSKQSPAEAERFQKELDIAKRVGIMLLEESLLCFLSRFGKWKLTLLVLHHSLEKDYSLFYAILHVLSSQLEVII